MANRREFLQAAVVASGAAAAFASLLPLPTKAAPAASPQTLHTVLFDRRHADSVRFAEQFAAQGVPVHGMAKGDISPFWRNELSSLWARAPVPLAGMTTAGPLFCLEQLGAQYGLRVVQREAQASGLIAWVMAPQPRV